MLLWYYKLLNYGVETLTEKEEIYRIYGLRHALRIRLCALWESPLVYPKFQESEQREEK